MNNQSLYKSISNRYLKEVDCYERTVLEQERARVGTSTRHHPQLIRANSEDRGDAGCLGFCGRKNRRLKGITAAES